MKAIHILDGDTFIKGSPIKAGVGSSILADSFGYDASSRLSSVTDQNNNSATYSYLANSMLVGQITFKQNGTARMTTAKQYDYLNRLTQIASAPSSSYVSPLTYNYNYNPANQRTKDTLADGSYWIYGYDSLGQVTNACKYWANGSLVAGQQFDYTFDTIGNRTQTQAGGDTNGLNLRVANYSANNLNQITQRDVPPYVDVIGASILTNSVTVNGVTAYRNQEYFRQQVPANNTNSALWTNIIVAGGQSVTGNVYVAQEPEQFSYDADGNLTNDGRWQYVWYGENRLIQMSLNTNVGPQYQLSFAYDPLGRRIQKIVSTNGVGIYTNNFLYDDWNLIATLSSSSALINSFMWGSDLSGSIQGAGGVGGLLEVSYYGTATTNCFPAYDGNGNVTALINAADGTLAADYEYGAFGEPIRITGAVAKNNPFRFSTKYDDDESDLLYYGYRFYKPSTGSWPNRDPLQERGGLNPYQFVRNDSVDKFDLDGRITVTRVYLSPDSDCGSYTVQWKFQLDQPAAADGYMVQQIDFDLSMKSCDGTPTTQSQTFWEAWPITKGQTLMDSYNGYSDQSSTGSHPDSNGHVKAKGVIKFFYLSTTGNLGGYNQPPPTPDQNFGNWSPNGSGQSGSLPSTNTKPSWWDNPSDDPAASREADSDWHCCCPYKNSTTISVTP